MESTIVFLLIGFLIGILLTSLIFILKNRNISTEKRHFQELSIQLQNQLNKELIQNKELQNEIQKWFGQNKVNESQADFLKQEVLNLKQIIQTEKLKFDELILEKMDLVSQNSTLNNLLENYKKERDELHKKSLLEFETIAQKLLEEKSDKFTISNKKNMEAILQPLNENIFNFKKQVEETYDKESKLRFSLDERIKELMSQTNKISAEANNLVNALKTNHKKQGDWGEMILESILQKSGLLKDREYRVQNNLVNNEGKNVRPDIIVDLPGNRSIVIDSKVSLNAYEAYCNADLKEEQQLFVNEHLKAIRSHIDDLSSKDYHQLVNGLDFTMLFIPIEPAYLLAIQQDPDLWNNAYQKRILLISPTNLIACLKLIVDLWNREKQDKSAQKIVKQAEKVYDKIVLFVKSFEQVGKQLQQAQDSFTKAQNQLKEGRGNVLSQTNQLLKYGIAPKKQLDELTEIEELEDDS